MIFISNLSAISNKSYNLAILPSSFIISTKAATDFILANLIRSTHASVCPARFKTPPSLEISGKICPGLPKSSGLVFSSTMAKIVLALSLAEMPVVQPCPNKSTDTVN